MFTVKRALVFVRQQQNRRVTPTGRDMPFAVTDLSFVAHTTLIPDQFVNRHHRYARKYPKSVVGYKTDPLPNSAAEK
jgi:hypothetical protein